jgi:hypothetical protein
LNYLKYEGVTDAYLRATGARHPRETSLFNWHQRMRLQRDASFRAWRVRSWPAWAADLTYRPIRNCLWQWLGDRYLYEWPRIDLGNFDDRSWAIWFTSLRWRWWKVADRYHRHHADSLLRASKSDRLHAYDDGFNDGRKSAAETALKWLDPPS